jgi:uncharacterized protein (TIGR02145 family)
MGTIITPSSPTSQFTGMPNQSYTLRWTISNSCGSSQDDVVISFAAFTCGYSYKDNRDSRVYNTVQIGTQCWMTQNLNYNWSGSRCYNDNSSNCDIYGRLYNVSGFGSLCPSGGGTTWHVPTDVEWCTLATYLDNTVSCSSTSWTGTDAGGKLKETGTSHWNSPNTGATNSSGFTALPGGTYTGSSYNDRGDYGYFWTNTSSSGNYYRWYMNNSHADIRRGTLSTSNFLSVRCLKN